MTDYKDKILSAFNDGQINEYMAKRLLSIKDLDDDLYGEVEQDAIDASGLGVTNDRDYNIYFFINTLSDDILNDTFGISVDNEKKKSLNKHLFEYKDSDEYSLDDLLNLRLLTHRWLCQNISKVAHPNIAGREDRDIQYDVGKWISIIKNIYAVLESNKRANKQDVVNRFTHDWDLDEKYKFKNWMKYYEEGTTEKYNVKTAQLYKDALDVSIPKAWISPQGRSENMNMSTYRSDAAAADGKTTRELELERARKFKSQMKSRLRSLKRLIDKYNDILPQHNLDDIYDEAHKLEKSISKLNVYASMRDCVIRSAGRIKKFGFPEGAEFLYKVADPAIGAETIQSLPRGETGDPNLPPESKASIVDVIDRLEGISKVLKSRDMIRELASVDILLNELGLASYFPELTDSQSKLIDAFGYASNKVESIVAKLRGSGATESISKTKIPAPSPVPMPTPVPMPPKPKASIETGEMLDKPMPEIKPELPKPE